MAENASPTEALHKRLDECIERYFQPCIPGPTLTRVLEVFANHERYAIDMAPALAANPAYVQLVLRTDFLQTRIKEWIAEMPEGQQNNRVLVERIFSLLGKQASRNLVTCIRLNRVLGVVPKKASERMMLAPKDQLKMALAAEDFCQSRDYAYSENAFLGGLQFDFLNAAMTKAKAPREALAALPQFFAESLKLAHMAYELGTHMQAFKFNGQVFAAALSVGVGRTLMSALFPKDLGPRSWATFLSDIDKQKYSRALFAQLNEKKRFDVTHNELSALFMSTFRFLRPIERAVALYPHPYFLKREDRDLYLLSALLHVASRAVSLERFGSAETAYLEDLGLTIENIQQAQTKVAKP